MVVKKITEENNKIINTMSFQRFPNPKNPRKIGRKWYKEEVMTVLATGQAMLIEKLLRNHGENPYNDVDELLGDLQIIGVEVLNQFNLKGGAKQVNRYAVEDMMSGGILAKGDK